MTTKEQQFSVEHFERLIRQTAKRELFVRITGKTRIYDENDPSVHEGAMEVADEAIREGVYRDTYGNQHKLNFRSPQELNALALAYFQRLSDSMAETGA